MDVRTGKLDNVKPRFKSSCCFVINPFIPYLNITKTVSEPELERFISLSKQSLEIISNVDFRFIDLFTKINDHLKCIRC